VRRNGETGQEQQSSEKTPEATAATAGVLASGGKEVPPVPGCGTESVPVGEVPPEPHSTPAVVTDKKKKGISTVPSNEDLVEAVEANPEPSVIPEERQPTQTQTAGGSVALGHLPPSPPKVAQPDAEDATLADTTKGPDEVLDLTGARHHAAEETPQEPAPSELSGAGDVPADVSAETAGATGAGPTEEAAPEVPLKDEQAVAASSSDAPPAQTEQPAATAAGPSEQQAEAPAEQAGEHSRPFPQATEGGAGAGAVAASQDTKAPEPNGSGAPPSNGDDGHVRKRKSSIFYRIKSAFMSPKKDKGSA
jgi:hypothetical protein